MNQHKAVFKAKVYSKKYRCIPKYEYMYYGSKKGGYKEYKMVETPNEELENKIIWDGVIDAPLLEKGEEFHISELDTTVKIVSCLRSTSGEVTYQTDYEFDLVEDDYTKKSKEWEEGMLEYLKPENAKQRALEEKWWYRAFSWLKGDN